MYLNIEPRCCVRQERLYSRAQSAAIVLGMVEVATVHARGRCVTGERRPPGAGGAAETVPSVGWEAAACWQAPDGHRIFLPQGRETPRQRRARETLAVRLCWMCPMLLPCREMADREQPAYGVWGGLTEGMRRSRQRRRNTAGDNIRGPFAVRERKAG